LISSSRCLERFFRSTASAEAKEVMQTTKAKGRLPERFQNKPETPET
jgi:hypothetical protein